MILIKYHQVVNFLITDLRNGTARITVKINKLINHSLFVLMSPCIDVSMSSRFHNTDFPVKKEVNETFVAQVD